MEEVNFGLIKVDKVMKKKFLAYEGEEFDIEWYFDSKGKSPALEYFEGLPAKQKEKLLYLFFMLGDTGKIRSLEKFRYKGDQIYAFKPMPDRFLCFFYEGSKVIVTNAYEKKMDKMPPREKEKSLKAKDDYIQRNKVGKYYEKES
jgi:mRNA-degrading endonuclease RelE of RelBE toxin-antitoxin system